MNLPLRILPPPAKPPLTVAEALRNIAREALERRQRAAEEGRPEPKPRPTHPQADDIRPPST